MINDFRLSVGIRSKSIETFTKTKEIRKKNIGSDKWMFPLRDFLGSNYI